MDAKERAEVIREGRVHIGLGLGIGALGVLISSDPLCYIGMPLFCAFGISKIYRARLKAASVHPTSDSSDPYKNYLLQAYSLADKIKIERSRVPTTDIPETGYFIRINDGRLELWCAERSDESPIVAGELDNILYEIFSRITFGSAIQYESDHRIESADCRRVIWKHQCDLMHRLNSDWLTDFEDEVRCTLIQNPYTDESDSRNNSSSVYSCSEVLKSLQEAAAKLRSPNSGSVGSARLAVLESVHQFLSQSGFPKTNEDKALLSLVPYYFQEANYDDLSWTSKSADLAHLQSIFEIDFAVQHDGLKRSAASKRLFNRYVWRHLLRNRRSKPSPTGSILTVAPLEA